MIIYDMIKYDMFVCVLFSQQELSHNDIFKIVDKYIFTYRKGEQKWVIIAFGNAPSFRSFYYYGPETSMAFKYGACSLDVLRFWRNSLGRKWTSLIPTSVADS